MKPFFVFIGLFLFLLVPLLHAAPVVNTATLTTVSGSTILVASANATDLSVANVSYVYALYKDNAIYTSGTIGGFPQNRLVNFVNFSVNYKVPGSYFVSVVAFNGTNISATVNSSAINVAPDPPGSSLFPTLIALAIMVGLMSGAIYTTRNDQSLGPVIAAFGYLLIGCAVLVLIFILL
jgi:FtsH-binding integral membrane protein